MSTYGLRWDQDAGLQVILSASGVPFEALPALVFEMSELSEFEQHQAARQLRRVTRRPNTTVTNLAHLIKEPMLSVSSQPGDYVQYKLEIYRTVDRGAEIVMEYPPNGQSMHFWSALMAPEVVNECVSQVAGAGNGGVDGRANVPGGLSKAVSEEADACTRLTFQLNEADMANLLGLYRGFPR